MKVVFAISLVPSELSDDWNLTQVNLRRTIGSIRGSTTKDYHIVVAAHDRPDLGETDCGDVTVLMAPCPIERDLMRRGVDKLNKRRLIGSWLRDRLDDEGAYVMFLDADDLVHRDLAGYVLRDGNRRSYLVEKGYIFDASTGMLSRKKARFFGTCGSCFICWFSRDELPLSWDDGHCLYSHFDLHREFGEVAAKCGKTADALPFHAVVYFTNHGESLRLKQFNEFREVEFSGLVLPREARRILIADFSVPDLAEAISGIWGVVHGISVSCVRRTHHLVLRHILRGRRGNGRENAAEAIRDMR